MKPGDKLDRLVAEKIMGWLPVDYGFGYQPPNDPSTQCLQPYSTDISSAWEVVKRLKSGECGFEPCCLELRWPICENPEVAITKYSESASPSAHEAAVTTAETMPLAICLAALKAVGAL